MAGKKRAKMRRLETTPEEFVSRMVELRTTAALAAHFNVTQHTITKYRTFLRESGVEIPSTPLVRGTKRRTRPTQEEAAALNAKLREAGIAKAA